MSAREAATQHSMPVTEDVIREALRKQKVNSLDDVVSQAVRAAKAAHQDAGENSLWIAYRSDKWVAMGPGVIEPQ